MTYPTQEHLFDIKTGNIRHVNEDIRFDYIDTALELLKMAACGEGGDTVIINTVLTTGEERSFTAELIEGEWWITLTLPESIDGVDGTDGREIELQKSTTHIQWRYVGDVDWIDLVALADLKGEQGEQGIQGIQGIQGVAGDDGEQGPQGEKGDTGDTGPAGSGGSGDSHPPVNEPSTNITGHICATTNYISDFLWARVSDYLTQAEANQANLDFAIDTVQAIVGLIPVLGSSVSWVADAVQGMFDLNLPNVEADFNSTFKETVSCKLYCLMKAANTVNYTPEVHTDFMNYLHTLPGGTFFHAAMGPIVEYVARADGYNTLFNRGAVGVLKAPDATCEALCTDCADTETFCYLFDFTQGQSSVFTPVVTANTYAVYIGSTGWRSNYFSSTGNNELRLQGSISPDMPFTKVTLVVSSDNNTDAFVYSFGAQSLDNPSGSNVAIVIDDDVTTGNLRIDITANAIGHDAPIYLHSVKFEGVGNNPFGSNNC
jgi:hypothetical protein